MQVITELVIKIVLNCILAGVFYILGKIKKKGNAWKDEYELSGEIVSLLYYQAIIWLAMLFFPFVALVSPLLMYINFKFSYFSLNKLHGKPLKSSNANVRSFFH